MKLSYNRKAADPIYYLSMSIRNKNKVTTKNILRIGKHSELLENHDDPLAYAKTVVARYNEDLKDKDIEEIIMNVNFTSNVLDINSDFSKKTTENIGYFILQKIYQDLEIKKFINKITANKKVTFNCDDINRFLTFSRILEPTSKYGTFDNLSNYFDHPEISNYVHILRFMDILVQYSNEYTEHLYKKSNNIVERDTSVCYYDCTNFYFHTKIDDSVCNETDPVTGKPWRTFHMYGRSKENRPLPIVQMGLFMDSQGIPLDFCLTPGNVNEQQTAIPTKNKLRKSIENKRFIYCADAGLGSYDIRRSNHNQGNSFIVTQSLKKLPDDVKEKCLLDDGFKLLSNNKKVTIEKMKTFDTYDENNKGLYEDKAYKVVPTQITDDLGIVLLEPDKNGNFKPIKSKDCLQQNIIVTFSREYYEYQLHVQNKQKERAKKMLADGKVTTLSKSQNDPKHLIKPIEKKSKDEFIIDEDVIQKEQQYFGFYAIATDLIDETNIQKLVSINSRRWKIEECFRVMKTNFETRPIYHQVDRRIEAHFLICYTALLIYRLLEVQLRASGYNCTTEEIIKTLRNMNVVNISDVYYRSEYTFSKTLEGFNFLYPTLNLLKENHRPNEIHKIIKKISS